MSTDVTVDPEAVLTALTEAGLVTDGEEVSLTESFREARRRARTALANDGEAAVLDEDVLDACERVTPEDDRELLASAAVVADETALSPAAVAAAAMAVGRFDSPPQHEGVPEGFTAIRGEEIEAYLVRNPTAMLYFWGHDCDPCDTLKADFEDMQEEGVIPENVELAAICGEDCYDLIRERYDVAVAPTTLFCQGGHVDARLIGAHSREAYESELEILAAE